MGQIGIDYQAFNNYDEEAEDGDVYVGDRLHYELAVILCLLVADSNHKVNGLWHWSFPQSSLSSE